MQLNYNDNGTGSYSGMISFLGGSLGLNGRPAINVPSGTATLTGPIYSTLSGTAPIGLTKSGAGTLLLTNASQSSDTGPTYINGGFVEVNSTFSADAGASYSALGSGNFIVASAGSATGGGLWLNNVSLGVNQNQTATDKMGFFDMYTGGPSRARAIHPWH